MKDMRLGKLQGSLWILSRNLEGWSSDFENRRIDPSSAVFFEGRFSGVKSNEDHVSKACDFSVINSRYSDCLDFVSRMTKKKIARPRFPSWFNEEVELCTHALEVDPILPRELWPLESGSNYLGPEGLSARRRLYRHWGRQLEPAQVSPVWQSTLMNKTVCAPISSGSIQVLRLEVVGQWRVNLGARNSTNQSRLLYYPVAVDLGEINDSSICRSPLPSLDATRPSDRD